MHKQHVDVRPCPGRGPRALDIPRPVGLVERYRNSYARMNLDVASRLHMMSAHDTHIPNCNGLKLETENTPPDAIG
jgi:hypothetical protein